MVLSKMILGKIFVFLLLVSFLNKLLMARDHIMLFRYLSIMQMQVIIASSRSNLLVVFLLVKNEKLVQPILLLVKGLGYKFDDWKYFVRRAENFNTSAVEFLRRLPGVTDSNYRLIMDGCKNLAELALLPMEKLAELMGGQKAAKTLRDFLDAKFPTLL